METDHSSTNCALAPPSDERQQSHSGSYGRDRNLDPTPFSDPQSVRFGRSEMRGACFPWTLNNVNLVLCLRLMILFEFSCDYPLSLISSH